MNPANQRENCHTRQQKLPTHFTMHQTINYWVDIKYTKQYRRKVWKYGGAKKFTEGLLRKKVHFYFFLKFGVQLHPQFHWLYLHHQAIVLICNEFVTCQGNLYNRVLIFRGFIVLNVCILRIIDWMYHFHCFIKNDTYKKRRLDKKICTERNSLNEYDNLLRVQNQKCT